MVWKYLPVFFSQRYTRSDERILRAGRVKYLVTDYRLTRSLPRLGFYYSSSEPRAFMHSRPISQRAFRKFDLLSHVGRVYDNGDVIIYDVGSLNASGL